MRTGGSVAFTDIVECHQDVNLTDQPFTGVDLSECEIAQWNMTTAVDVDEAPGSTDIEKVLVDGKPIDDGVDVLLDQVDPSGIVYQSLEHSAALNDILEVDTVFFVVCVRFYVPDPSASFTGISIGGVHGSST